MMQVHVYGPCTGPEGYSEVTRGFVRALDARGWNVKLEPFNGWGPWKVGFSKETSQLLTRCANNKLYPSPIPVAKLSICLPEQVVPADNMLNVNLTMFEADRIASSWVEAARVIDQVIVPNQFCSHVFTRSGIPKNKVGVVPLGFDPAVFSSEIEPLPLTVGNRDLASFPVRILSILEVTNRKNFGGLLELYFKVAAILGADNCCLILKASNYSTHLPLSRKIKSIRDSLVEDGKIPDLHYNVVNYAPIVPSAQMGAFMRTATHYVSMSLAEGWDLNCLNAMACSIPVVIPNHSGYTEYCTAANSCLLPIAMKVPAAQQGATGRLYAGANWFAPDADESAQIAASYIQDGAESAKRTNVAYNCAHGMYTWDRCAAALERHLTI